MSVRGCESEYSARNGYGVYRVGRSTHFGPKHGYNDVVAAHLLVFGKRVNFPVWIRFQQHGIELSSRHQFGERPRNPLFEAWHGDEHPVNRRQGRTAGRTCETAKKASRSYVVHDKFRGGDRSGRSNYTQNLHYIFEYLSGYTLAVSYFQTVFTSDRYAGGKDLSVR